MKNKIDELRDMAAALLATDDSRDDTRKKWGENVRDLLQELSIYHFELEHQNAALEESEHDLVESRAKYVELFEEAPVGYVVIDRGMNIIQVNHTFDEMVVPNYPCDSCANGHRLDELVCPEYQNAFQRFFNMLMNSGSILPIELKIWNRFGQPCFVTMTAGKRKLGDDLFRLTVTDINTRKKMEL
ncbi:MAG: PAS domain-containing protein, partial [Planctomycetia bacterium]|nr:PAS domain-containing protein [Planctomycetia bacterium]